MNQFIVITHAKRTRAKPKMEAAQPLYGMTMQEPGVWRYSTRHNSIRGIIDQ
jgi:chromosome segregation ATPase